MKRKFILFGITLFLTGSLQADSWKLAFGSCLHQDKPAPILEKVQKENPDLLVLLGDNIYLDSKTAETKRAAYEKQLSRPFFVPYAKRKNLLVTWDDHDYGENDSGAEYEDRAATERLYWEVWSPYLPTAFKRGSNEGGVYGSFKKVWKGKTIHIVLLDTRSFRSPLQRTFWSYLTRKHHYTSSLSSDNTMLGEDQWEWLEKELLTPSDLLILVSSVQILSTEHPFEKWGNFPLERERMFSLLTSAKAKEFLLLSGDRHIAELHQINLVGKEIWEITSSSLNLPLPGLPLEFPSSTRFGDAYREANFGLLTVSERDKKLEWNLEIKTLGSEVPLTVSSKGKKAGSLEK